MKGPGGLPSLEIGQHVAKAAKQQLKQWANASGAQLTGKYPQNQANPNVVQQSKASDARGDFSSLFESNQTQQNPIQRSISQIDFEKKFADQHNEDLKKLEATRKNIQEIEEKIEVISEKREKEWKEAMQEEEKKENKKEFIKKEEEKLNPIATLLKIRKHEGGKSIG